MGTYSKDIDYAALIKEAAERGDFVGAAQNEQLRNAKIAGEGITGVTATNDYVGNLDQTDYSTMLKDQIASGADVGKVSDTLNSRITKANSAVNLKGNVNDDVFAQAMNYIKNGNQSFNYKDAPAYVNQNQAKIDALTNEVLNGTYAGFKSSGEYGALEGQYVRNGQRAMQDTVGDVSARTGGLASSYAATAGQQAYGNQMTALEQAAMEMFSNEKSDKYNKLNALMGIESQNYGKYQDQLNQYNTDRSTDYTISQNNRTDLENKAKTLAAAGDFSGYKALGYTDAEIAKLTAAWQAANAPKYSGGGGGKVGTTPTVTSNRPNYGNATVNQVNVTRDNGYSTQEILAGAQKDYKSGAITKKQYDAIVDAALRKR